MAEHSIGTAWIQVSPSMKGFRSAVQKELGALDTTPAEKKIESGLGGAFSRVGKIASGTLAVASSVALAAGFADVAHEAVLASDATDKFKTTLSFAGQSSADIERLTKSTKAYADKTVYGLSDIQSVTAQLAANNVKDYDRLAEAAGNLNAVAGGSAQTFKSVGMVMTQTAGSGKLTTENFNQLADAIPGASGKLQQALLEAGAYTGDFRDAMQKGEVTAQEFNDAVMGLGLTDVAQEAATSTSTIEGAWGNLQASLVSGGMSIVDRIKPALTSFMGAVATGAETAFTWINDTLLPGLEGVYDILVKGDFHGSPFGLEEDSGVVDFLFNVRDAAAAAGNWISGTLVPGVENLATLVATGDFSGSFFGVQEDSGLVDFIISVRDTVISLWGTLRDSVIPGVKSFIMDVGSSPVWQTVLGFLGQMVQSKPVLVGVVSTFIAWKAATAAWSLGKMTVDLVRNTAAWVSNTAAMIASKSETIALMAMYTGEFIANLVRQGVQLAVNTGAWIAQNAAVLAVRAGTIAYTGAQWLLNAAMNANPIGLIVIGLVALGAAIAVAWNRSETFRNIVTGAWEGIKNAVGVVVDWLTAYVWPAVEAVWTGIKLGVAVVATAVSLCFQAWRAVISTVVDWLVANVWPLVQSVWDGIRTGASNLWTGIQVAWNGIMTGVQTVASWFTTYVQPVIVAVWEAIKAGANLLRTGIQVAWNGIMTGVQTVASWFTTYVQPVIVAVWEAIKAGANLLRTGIQVAWNGIMSVVQTVASWFTTYVQPVVQSVWDGIRTGASSLWTSITNVWDGIRSAISTVVDWMRNTMQTAVTTMTTKVGEAFSSAKDTISTAWNKIKEVAAKPINFVITTVYRDGIKKTFDSIAEKLGLSTRLPDVTPIAGYASGGVLPGYSPGRDIYHFTSSDGGGRLALSGGEAIMRPEWTRAVGGPRAVAAMNRAARYGTPIPGGDAGGVFQFADGGIWGRIKNAVSSGVSSVTGWISSAAEAAASIISDPLGAVANLIKAPVDALLRSVPGAGMLVDIAKAVPGRAISWIGEWLKGETATMSASDLVSQARLAIGTPYVWGGVDVPGGVDCSGLVVWALRKMGYNVPRHTAATFQASSVPVSSPVPGDLAFWGAPAHHVAVVSGQGMMVEAPTFGQTVRETAVYGSPTYGRFRYDDGGYLQPGLSVVENRTGRPEPVFTSGQFSKMDQLVGLLREDRARDLVVRDVNDELVGRMRAEADGRIIEAQQL